MMIKYKCGCENTVWAGKFYIHQEHAFSIGNALKSLHIFPNMNIQETWIQQKLKAAKDEVPTGEL